MPEGKVLELEGPRGAIDLRASGETDLPNYCTYLGLTSWLFRPFGVDYGSRAGRDV